MAAGFYAGTTVEYRKIVPVTLSLDTSAYANGDVLAATQVVDGALRITNGTGVLESIAVLDEDDQTAYAFDVYILSANVALGTENAAISITDANARNILGVVSFAAADAKDLINSKLYYKSNLGIPLVAITDTDDIAVAVAVLTGTPTHSASGVTMRLGIRQD